MSEREAEGESGTERERERQRDRDLYAHITVASPRERGLKQLSHFNSSSENS